MSSHSFTQDGPRRAVELLMRAQAAGPEGLEVYPLAEAWGVSWQTVRRLIGVAEAAAEAAAHAPRRRGGTRGTLERRGSGPRTRLVWTPAGARGGRHTETVALAASLGPWRALGIDDVASVLERQLRGAMADVPAERAALVRDLLDRGFYYQSWMPRKIRDPEAVDGVLSALFYRCALTVRRYHSPRVPRTSLHIEPWTLVQALDGLYVLGPEHGRTQPAMWALHRMEDVTWHREQPVSLPRDYRPEALVGHGYGPFIGAPGEVTIRVPASEAPWVLESPLHQQIGEPEPLPDGSYRVRLGVAYHLGIRLWARGVGVTVE